MLGCAPVRRIPHVNHAPFFLQSGHNQGDGRTAKYLDRLGVRSIIDRLRAQGELSPEGFVDTCLDLMGPLEVSDGTRRELVDQAQAGGALGWATERGAGASRERVAEILQLIVSLRDYQYA